MYNLIMAYHEQFLSWNNQKIKKYLFDNKLLNLGFLLLISLILISIVLSMFFKSVFPLAVMLVLEIILSIILNRFSMKRYRKLILKEKNHLNKVVLLLKTAIPGVSLFSNWQIDFLIDLLTKYINSNLYSDLKGKIISFAKTIILPIIAYLFGAFSNNISKLDPITLSGYAVFIIFILGIIYILCCTVSKGLRKLVCSEYDAAVAFREDLLNIKLTLLHEKVRKRKRF